MTIPGSANPLLLKAAAGGYAIERSVRFNSSDSAYLSRTPASAGNRKTWTWAGWVKLSDLASSDFTLFSGGTTSAHTATTIIFFRNNKLCYSSITQDILQTEAVCRDASAWYHIVVALDTTQATASNRLKFYVNGSQITQFSTDTRSSQLAQNTDYGINNTEAHGIGRFAYNNSKYLSGYLADVFLIDGQALDPTSFGEFDDNGIWQPIAYSGSYGTNGFHLPFSDNSTAAALGTDSSGNGNTWTVNNISVAAGAGNDSLVDVPTNGVQPDTGVGGEVRGNYATLNPLNKSSNVTLANGNLEISTSATNTWKSTQGTIGVSSGKWYWEVLISGASNYHCVGVGIPTKSMATAYDTGEYGIWMYDARAYKIGEGGANNTSYGATYGPGDIIGVALDSTTGTIVFYKNGVAQGTAFSTGLAGVTVLPQCGVYYAGTVNTQTANFGQRPFAYTAPSGFKALNTANLPEGAITTSGTFTGNANADGPFVYLNGIPTAMTINGNAVTFATHADKLSNGFKLRTSSTSYNTSGSNTYFITTTGDKFKFARAQPNP